MKTTTPNQTQTSKATLVVLFVLLLSSVGMFGQTAAPANAMAVSSQTSVAADDTKVATAAATEAASSNLNIVSWFMGSKQTPKATISNEGAESSKKQLINAGIAPNRLLIKAFGKKAANYQSTIA